MATTNDITGDSISSKANSNKFRDGWDLIFSKKKKVVEYDEWKDRAKKEFFRLGLNTDDASIESLIQSVYNETTQYEEPEKVVLRIVANMGG